nr:immunoglobulin heavy chain junction region [Mus musculus]
ITVQELT